MSGNPPYDNVSKWLLATVPTLKRCGLTKDYLDVETLRGLDRLRLTANDAPLDNEGHLWPLIHGMRKLVDPLPLVQQIADQLEPSARNLFLNTFYAKFPEYRPNDRRRAG